MTTWRRLIALLALALAAALPTTASAGPAPALDDHLALQATDVPGLTPLAAHTSAARAAFVAVLRAGSGTVSPTRVDAAAYRAADGATALEAQAFAFADAGRAGRALVAWQRAQRRAGRATSPIAAGAAAHVTARKRGGTARVEIVLRVGATLALVRLRDAGALLEVRDTATSYARLAAARLAGFAARTAADRVADGIAADGTVPPATLLQLAAQSYGPMAGVALPPGPPGRPVLDRTVLLEQLVGHADAFTPAQRQALERRLFEPAAAPAAASARRMPREAGTCPWTPDGPLLLPESLQAAAYRDAIARSISTVSLTPTWTVCVYRYEDDGGPGYAQTVQWSTEATTTPRHAGALDSLRYFGLASNMCYVQLFPRYFASTPQNQAHQLAHEMYHCLHKEWNHGSWLDSAGNPPWAEESLATWAAQTLAPGTYEPTSEVPGQFYLYWQRQWPRPLFERPYAAWGFFGVVEQAAGAGALWNRILPIWEARNDSPAVFEAAVGAQRDQVLDTWGAGHFQQAGFPGPWLQRLPFTVPDTGRPDDGKPTVHLGAGSTTLPPTTGYRADMWVVKSDGAPLVNVMLAGHGRVTDGATDWVHPASQWVCFGGRCTCPPGTHPNASMPDFANIGASLYAGLAAADGTSSLTLDAHAMDDFCDRDDPPPGGGGDGGGRPGGAQTHNDPHIVSFDSVAFDFNAAGEFVLARTADRAFEVQVRQEPASEARLASSNTAVAMRLDGHRVAVYGGDRVTLRVDGRVRTLSGDGNQRLAVGGGNVRRIQSAYVVRWPDGTQVSVDGFRPTALWVSVLPSDALRGRLTGVLGSNDGVAENDLATAGGRRLAYTLPTGGDYRVPRFAAGVDDFAWLHGPFADSWRVTRPSSLFDYRRGESTSTFTDRSMPATEFTLADLSAILRARARRACAAVVDPWFRAACERDVGITNDRGYAASARRAEQGRAGWRPLDGFENRVGRLAASLDVRDGTAVFAAQNAVFGVETLATVVAVPRGAAAHDPVVVERGLVGEPSPFRAADGSVSLTLPVIDLATGLGAIRTYATSPDAVTRGADVAAVNGLDSGPAPAALASSGQVTVANGGAGLELHTDLNPATPPVAIPDDGMGCSRVTPAVAASGGTAWLAWTGLLCAPSGPRAMRAGAVGEVLRAPGAVENQLLPTQLATALAVRPDGTAVLAYPGRGGSVLLWHAGDVDPITVGSTAPRLAETTLVTAEPTTGRIWVAWRDPAKGVLHVRRSDPSGRSFGADRTLDPPVGLAEQQRRAGEWTMVADDGRLVLAFSVPGTSSRPGSAWYTACAAGERPQPSVLEV